MKYLFSVDYDHRAQSLRPCYSFSNLLCMLSNRPISFFSENTPHLNIPIWTSRLFCGILFWKIDPPGWLKRICKDRWQARLQRFHRTRRLKNIWTSWRSHLLSISRLWFVYFEFLERAGLNGLYQGVVTISSVVWNLTCVVYCEPFHLP